jgi:hypothetical protein
MDFRFLPNLETTALERWEEGFRGLEMVKMGVIDY